MVIFSQFTLKYVYFGSDDYNNDGDDDNDNDDYNDHGDIFLSVLLSLHLERVNFLPYDGFKVLPQR